MLEICYHPRWLRICSRKKPQTAKSAGVYMAIPDYETIMQPLLQFANDGQVHKFRDACDALAKHFGVTEQELHLLLPSGRYPIFRSRVGWAKTYLTFATGHF